MPRPMTITEKIFAAHAGLDEVKAGDLITAKVDITLANDITGPVAIKEFKKIGVDKVFDKDRVIFVPDHFVPNKDIKSGKEILSVISLCAITLPRASKNFKVSKRLTRSSIPAELYVAPPSEIDKLYLKYLL